MDKAYLVEKLPNHYWPIYDYFDVYIDGTTYGWYLSDYHGKLLNSLRTIKFITPQYG